MMIDTSSNAVLGTQSKVAPSKEKLYYRPVFWAESDDESVDAVYSSAAIKESHEAHARVLKDAYRRQVQELARKAEEKQTLRELRVSALAKRHRHDIQVDALIHHLPEMEEADLEAEEHLEYEKYSPLNADDKYWFGCQGQDDDGVLLQQPVLEDDNRGEEVKQAEEEEVKQGKLEIESIEDEAAAMATVKMGEHRDTEPAPQGIRDLFSRLSLNEDEIEFIERDVGLVEQMAWLEIHSGEKIHEECDLEGREEVQLYARLKDKVT